MWKWIPLFCSCGFRPLTDNKHPWLSIKRRAEQISPTTVTVLMLAEAPVYIKLKDNAFCAKCSGVKTVFTKMGSFFLSKAGKWITRSVEHGFCVSDAGGSLKWYNQAYCNAAVLIFNYSASDSNTKLPFAFSAVIQPKSFSLHWKASHNVLFNFPRTTQARQQDFT